MEVSNVEDATGEQSHFMAICSKIFLILTGFFYITNKSSGGKEDPSLRDSFYDLSTSGRSSSSKGTHLFSKKNNNI